MGHLKGLVLGNGRNKVVAYGGREGQGQKDGYDMGHGDQTQNSHGKTVQKWEALRGMDEHNSVVVEDDGGAAMGLSREGEGMEALRVLRWGVMESWEGNLGGEVMRSGEEEQGWGW